MNTVFPSQTSPERFSQATFGMILCRADLFQLVIFDSRLYLPRQSACWYLRLWFPSETKESLSFSKFPRRIWSQLRGPFLVSHIHTSHPGSKYLQPGLTSAELRKYFDLAEVFGILVYHQIFLESCHSVAQNYFTLSDTEVVTAVVCHVINTRVQTRVRV